MPIDIEDVLGKPAIFQILSKKRSRSEAEQKELAAKIESSCKRFKNNHGSLSIDDYYNVIKLQHGVEVSKDELRLLVADLDMDRHFRVSIKDFMTVPIISEAVFTAMDKNKDGFISRAELKLAKRSLTREQLDDIIGKADDDGDGKLTFDEVRKIALKLKENKPS